jgi:hypothetical protein
LELYWYALETNALTESSSNHLGSAAAAALAVAALSAGGFTESASGRVAATNSVFGGFVL